MALAAVEALRADGRAGKVPVTGIDGIQLAVEAILKGDMVGTVAWDPFWQGGMGLSIAFDLATLMGYEAASILDSGVIPSVEVSVEKVFTSELRHFPFPAGEGAGTEDGVGRPPAG